MRACARCGDEFEPWGTTGNGVTYCRPCHAAKNREWREANPEKWREVARRSRRKNRPPVAPPRTKVVIRFTSSPASFWNYAVLRCQECRSILTAREFPKDSTTCRGCRTEKECAHCHEVKPLGDFYAHKGKPDGLTSYCKPCSRERRRKWAAANPQKVRQSDANKKALNRAKWSGGRIGVAEKRCGKCKETKASGEFHHNAETSDGLHWWCKLCRGRWVDANKAKFRDYSRKRQMREREVEWEKIDRQVVFDRDGGKCHICRKAVDPHDWHLDHLWPLSRGGSHTYSNVAVSHPTCNMRKYAKVQPTQLLIR